MNYIFVRTKLQALIAELLIKKGIINIPYSLVCMYQHNRQEDHISVYQFYERLAIKASKCIHIVEANGFWRKNFQNFKIVFHSKISGGKCYLASIDSYPFALAIKFNPGARIITFDDGSANIQSRESSYLSVKPLIGGGVKRKISRFLFPEGAKKYLRNKTENHFTIYASKDNIVSNEKLEIIDIDWISFVSLEIASGLPRDVKRIFLGTVYEEIENGEKLFLKAKSLMGNNDIYIPHPREKINAYFEQIYRLSIPAESLIAWYSKSNKIELFHFNSSAALTFEHDPQVKCIDLLANDWKQCS